MSLKRYLGPELVLLACVLALALTAGCSSRPTVEPASTAPYTGALSTTHEDALDVTSQLALGTLKLEGTENAITEAQAAQLLPFWKVLGGSALQVERERLAVAEQIETAMTQAQIAAIAAMALTQADEQTWMRGQGPRAITGATDGSSPGGAAPVGAAPAGAARGGAAPAMSEEDRAAMREKFQNMTEEERAAMAGQFTSQGDAAGIRPRMGGGTSSGVVKAVMVLLAERNGQTSPLAARPQAPVNKETTEITEAAVVDVTPTTEPTATPVLEPTAEPTATLEAVTPTVPPTATAEAATARAASAAAPVQPEITEDAAQVTTRPAAANVGSVVSSALVHVEDTDPGPPFSVEISLNQATPNPLLDGTEIYRVSGLLHNDGDATYAVNTVHITFFDASGFRGSFNPFPRRRYGEYIWHGAMEADFDCMLLAPGEACPFTAEIAAYDMGSFLVHADAVVAEWREPATVHVQGSTLVDQGSNVQISGTVVNPNSYAVKNVVVNGALLDANGRITSIGSAYLVQSIAPGAAASFTAMVPWQAYTSYQLYVQAEGDFD